MDLDVLCPMCNKHSESTVHALWTCPALREIRSCCSVMISRIVKDNVQFVDLLLSCKNNLAIVEFEFLCILFWRIWTRRNGSSHGHHAMSANKVVTWARFFLDEYKQVTVSLIGQVYGVAKSMQKWEPLTIGKIVEASALYQGLVLARETGLWSCEVELDAQVVVNLVSSPMVTCSKVGPVVHDIKGLLSLSKECKIRFVPKKANMVAHCLAKLGCSVESNGFWLET
ncbi:hypothetical protein Ddye_017463 [Dipteronia dyeriana]|uniref:RNase H type-1 domain-containing protein n=1 Tax=Dipteronia dyeriana TaxID=168575 RepID=A0AAD9U991_9ROSI|nr:hypothetical protein Ddye_017463 [Dipteronia dyeriana]